MKVIIWNVMYHCQKRIELYRHVLFTAFMLHLIRIFSFLWQVFFRFHMLDKVQTSTMQYEPAVIQASDNPPSREISYKSILNKVCILTQLL
jgi:hypothetical protein